MSVAGLITQYWVLFKDQDKYRISDNTCNIPSAMCTRNTTHTDHKPKTNLSRADAGQEPTPVCVLIWGVVLEAGRVLVLILRTTVPENKGLVGNYKTLGFKGVWNKKRGCNRNWNGFSPVGINSYLLGEQWSSNPGQSQTHLATISGVANS